MCNNQNNRMFAYDNLMDYDYLKELFDKANEDFLSDELNIIRSNVTERMLCGSLKTKLEMYLQQDNVGGYHVDLEYNRNQGHVKTIIDDELHIVNIVCDLIIHSRGQNVRQDNLLALEMKKSYRSQKEKDSDRRRLIALTKSTFNNDIWSYDGKTFPEHVCRYIIGIYYEIDLRKNKIIIEYYRQGKLIKQRTVNL